MSVWAVTMVKDEADVLPFTLARMQAQVDGIIVADNGSTDGTRELLAAWERADPSYFRVLDDDDPAYYQSVKMSALAAKAARQGAHWVIPFDADEVWLSPDGMPLRQVLPKHTGASVIHAELYDHVPTAEDATETHDPTKRMGWRRRTPLELPKVAVRPALKVTIAQGNHGASYPVEVGGGLQVRHFSHRSPEQFVRKVRNGSAAYEATTLPESVGAHWRQYGQVLKASGEDAVASIFREFFYSPDPQADDSLVYDPLP